MKLHSSRRGVAVISALAFLVITGVLVGTAMLVGASNRRLSAENMNTSKAQLAAESGVERVIFESWYPATSTITNDFKKSLVDFRATLDTQNILAGVEQGGLYEFGAAQTFSASLDDGTSYEVSVRRADVSNTKTVLRVDSRGYLGTSSDHSATRRITEDLIIANDEFGGGNFALLTNNADCILCHTTITSMEVAYHSDCSNHPLDIRKLTTTEAKDCLAGQERVKVGALQSLIAERDELNSVVAGTIYTRGTTNVLTPASDFSGFKYKNINGSTSNLLANATSSKFSLLPKVDCGSSCSEQNASFYTNYPLENYPDGELPNEFPLPVADKNDNRLVDHSEWQSAIADDASFGSLSGGNKQYMPTSQSGTDSTQIIPDKASGLSSVGSLPKSPSRGVTGNVVLVGTESDPLVLDGTVYVDGDVLIRGKVTGKGKIVARGNVYVSGDITYACDADPQDAVWNAASATDCEYGNPDNLPLFGLVSGKSTMIGSYAQQWATTTKRALDYLPSDQLTRLDFSSTSSEELARFFIDPGYDEYLPDGTPEIGTCCVKGLGEAGWDPDFGVIMGTGFTTQQMMFFNQQEYLRAKTDLSYKPRFYKLRDSAPLLRCEKEKKGVSGLGCNAYDQTEKIAEASILDRASVVSLNPTGDWISELDVREAWTKAIETNTARQEGPLRLDGIVYSSNGLFAIMGRRSKTQSKMTINGSIIAADTGFLVTGVANKTPALNVFYDQRLKSLLGLQEEDLVQTRTNFRLLKANETLEYNGLQN